MIDVRFSAMWGRVASLSSISFRNIFWKSFCIVLPRCVNACDDCMRPRPQHFVFRSQRKGFTYVHGVVEHVLYAVEVLRVVLELRDLLGPQCNWQSRAQSAGDP